MNTLGSGTKIMKNLRAMRMNIITRTNLHMYGTSFDRKSSHEHHGSGAGSPLSKPCDVGFLQFAVMAVCISRLPPNAPVHRILRTLNTMASVSLVSPDTAEVAATLAPTSRAADDGNDENDML